MLSLRIRLHILFLIVLCHAAISIHSLLLLFTKIQYARLAHGELETCIMTQHLIAAEVHGITALGMPAMSKAIVGLGKEAHIVMGLGEGILIGSPALRVVVSADAL